MNQLFDVAIIGSGPSGAIAAYKLAEKGFSVIIIEKEEIPRYKTCGGGLVARGKNMIPFDISSVIDSEFKEIDIHFSKQNIHLKSRRKEPIVSMVMRDKFDELIVLEAKKLGVILKDKHKLLCLDFSENIKLTTNQEEFYSKFVIAADGALSQTAKLAGWKTDTRYLVPALEYELSIKPELFDKIKLEARFDVDFIPQGYAWCFPKKNHLSIGVASLKRSKLNLRQYFKEYLEVLNINQDDIISEAAHGFQVPITHRDDGFVKNNVFLVGDTAGFADPITAEGISNAIYSGILAAESLIESNLDSEKAKSLYIEKLNQKLLPELKTANYIAKIFYKQVTIRNFLIKRSGDQFSDFITDIFMGTRSYPNDLVKVAKKKIKKLFVKS